MMLSVLGLKASYDRAPVLDGISLEVGTSQIVALIGSNGAGKSSLLKAIMGAMPHVDGQILFKGDQVLGKPSAEIVRRGISLVPEGRRIFGSLTVAENLKAGGYIIKDRSFKQRKIEEIFEMFPRLAERRSFLGSSLSGGEQEMLAIGRALMARPNVLLLDEPSMGLAPLIVDQVFASLVTLRASGMSILLVEQDARRALDVADFGYVLENGRIALSGSGKELATSAHLADAYLGRAL
jgi:branched-chain amino acid transport system ATP-binding protein